MTLVKHYAQPWRHFHTFDHIERLLKAAVWYYNRTQQYYPRNLSLAILYHDAVYLPGATDNEEKSAELCNAKWDRGLLDCDRFSVRRMILATKEHKEVKFHETANVMLSCDLVSLAAPWPQFCLDAENVCREYRYAYDEEKVRQDRLAFYESFLAREHIYPHPYFQKTHERRARANLYRALLSKTTGVERAA